MSSTHRLAVGPLACLLALVLVGCEDYRFTGTRAQVDTFLQEGSQAEDLFEQTGRERMDEFLQEGTIQVDAFEQKANALVDILWVVDNSASMLEEQDSLATNFDAFMSTINLSSTIDFHIGVISTDMDQPTHKGQLLGTPKVIDRTTQPDPKTAFAANVHVGTSGGGNEMGLLAASFALTEPLSSGANSGFLRDDAALAVIFVSDENDKSFGTVNYYQRFFATVKDPGNENKIIVAFIAGPMPDGCSAGGGIEAAPATLYDELNTAISTAGINSTFISICEPQFTTALSELGFAVAGLRRKFLLSGYPDLDFTPLTVSVDPDGAGPNPAVEVPAIDPGTGATNWEYRPEERAISFPGDYVPPPGSSIVVEYGGLKALFHLSGRGEEDTIVVTVDDVVMTVGDDYTYDPDSNSIIFAPESVPGKDSRIVVSSKVLLREFPLSQTVDRPETLVVEIDMTGSGLWQPVEKGDLNGWMFNTNTNRIQFLGQFVPPLGSMLRVTYNNLQQLFSLSLIPLREEFIVTLDLDGEGGEMVALVPPYDANTARPGWIYYSKDQPPPYTNSISFEHWGSAIPAGAVVTVAYLPEEQTSGT